jgi:hypothetical protein
MSEHGPAGTVGTSEHGSVAAVTISTHRLWISLWTPLGRPADNASATVGNARQQRPDAAFIHRLSPGGAPACTRPVGTGTPPYLGVRPLSPGSTVPMTTTFCSSSGNQERHRWLADTSISRVTQRAPSLVFRSLRDACSHTPPPARPSAGRADLVLAPQ